MSDPKNPGEGKPADSFSDFDATVSAFQGRMNKQIKAREEAIQEADEATTRRQMRVLEQMVKIRKSLRQVAELDLGFRFSFKLVLDDWEGWPRMIVQLVDSVNPIAEFAVLQVIASDRLEDGLLEFQYADEKDPETLELGDVRNVRKVPSLLKKCVREHLDMIAELIDEEESKMPSSGEQGMEDDKKEEAEEEPKKGMKRANSFSSDIFQDDEPPSMDDKLPELEDNLGALDISFDTD